MLFSGVSKIAREIWKELFPGNNSLNVAFARHARRYIASLVARMPVLLIAAADDQLPTPSRDGNTEEHYVITSLEIKWRQVGITIGAIVLGQIPAILVVLFYCRRVHIRDDSYLSIAHLLKTLVSMVDVNDGRVATGKELATHLDSLGQEFKYGTRASGNRLILDLSDDVEGIFLLGRH